MRGQLPACPSTTTTSPGWPTRSTATHPGRQPGVLNYTMREPLGVVGTHHPVELAAAVDQPQARARARRRQHRRRQAVRAHVSLAARARRTRRGGRVPAGCVNVVTGFGRRGRPGAGRPPQPGQDLVHRQHRHRLADRRAPRAQLIGSTLELGGKSPNIVFDDADVATRRVGVVAGSSPPPGRPASPAAGSSPQQPIYDELLERVTERARSAPDR